MTGGLFVSPQKKHKMKSHSLGVNVRRIAILLVLSLSASSTRLLSEDIRSAKEDPAASPLDAPARSWIVDAAANELIALHHKNSYIRYRSHSVSEKGDTVRDVVESKDGTVARLIMRDRKPLTEDQDKAERSRLHDMIASPSAYFRHVRNSESELRIADRLVPLMPDAMIYTYTPGQPQTGTNPTGGIEIVIDYKPNPSWKAPGTEAEALEGLQGRVWIDAKTRRLVRMEGMVFRSVNFGWGVLAHIYPGGRLVLNQTVVGDNRWIFSNFSMELTVRALMVKSVAIKAHVDASNFQTLEPMSYQDAIKLMLSTPLPAE